MENIFFLNRSYLFYSMSTDECHLLISISPFSSIRFSLELPLIALPLHPSPLHLFRLFQLRSVSHPMHNSEFWLFYECVITGNSESMNLPQSLGCLLLPSVSCTFSCNADGESVDAVKDRIRGTPHMTILWDPKAKYFAYLQQKINPLTR